MGLPLPKRACLSLMVFHAATSTDAGGWPALTETGNRAAVLAKGGFASHEDTTFAAVLDPASKLGKRSASERVKEPWDGRRLAASTQCQACCGLGGTACHKAYKGEMPGICCGSSPYTCCPNGTTCIQHGQGCRVPPTITLAPSANVTKSPSESVPLIHGHPHTWHDLLFPNSQRKKKTAIPSAKNEDASAGTTSLPPQFSAPFNLGSLSHSSIATNITHLSGELEAHPLKLVLGIVILVAAILCCISMFCLKEICDCLGGGSGRSLGSPHYGGQILPIEGSHHGQYPGHYQGQFPGQFQGQYPPGPPQQSQYSVQYPSQFPGQYPGRF
mmetsp:Transcript_76318/g.150916  ORF Transcript_76318/g.150916 Transcript_76318/m.150916 type:complete len:329 (-) Transcript_76318:276-1262(-)